MGRSLDNPGRTLLVVDDDPVVVHLAKVALAADHEVIGASTAEQALGLLSKGGVDLVLTDLRLPGVTGLDLLRQIHESAPELPVLVMTAFASIVSAVDAMRAGATDYITKPLEADDIRHRVRQALRLRRLEAENRWLHRELTSSYSPSRIIAVSAKMREVVETVEKLASTRLNVLITGESGTGKELLARALHHGSERADGPFVAINCAALPRDLVESELFGSAQGAFTGAHKDRPGKLEAAHGGTLFLDEVGELPLDVQPKLLRALEERAFERIGENKLRRVDLRLVAATNRNLQTMAAEGRFREDLYFRIAVAPIHVPPLRERIEDIVPLARFLVGRFAGADAPELGEDACLALVRQAWPGNVRQLANALERALALHGEGPIVAAEVAAGDRPIALPRAAPLETGRSGVVLPSEGAPLDDMVRDLVTQALEKAAWNQTAAARLLRIPRHVLQYRMEKYGIEAPPAP